MGRRAFTQDLYAALGEYFKRHPGDNVGAARAVGCDTRTAKRAWEGPTWEFYPWAVPFRDGFLAAEAERRAEAKAEEERVAQAAIAAQEKARKAEEELAMIDQQTAKLAKVAVHRGLTQLVSISEGVVLLGKRLNEQLAKGVDAQGNPLDIDPAEALKIMGRFAGATKQLIDAHSTLAGVDRVAQGLPSAIVGIDVASVTFEDAEAEVERANEALARARALGLVIHDGGRKSG